MSEKNYKRIDVARVLSRDVPAAESVQEGGAAESSKSGGKINQIRWTLFPLVLLLCFTQSYLTIAAENYRGEFISGSLIGVVAFTVLFLLVLFVNPFLRAIWTLTKGAFLRPLNRAELFVVFAPLLITSGISTFGLTSHLIPLIAGPYNPSWNTDQRGWNEDLTNPENPALNTKLYITDTETLTQFREGFFTSDLPDWALGDPPEGFWASSKHTFLKYQYVSHRLDWWAWIRPISYWLVFIFGCYGLFYCLTYVVLRYWADREKLIFPLAQLPMSLMPEPGSKRWLPPIFTSTTFWVGMTITGFVLSWNALVAWNVLDTGFRIPMGLGRRDVSSIAEGTFLHGLSGLGEHETPFLVIFTAIGISFLLPTQISFSTWFYFLIARLMLLAAVLLGFGENTTDFPSNFLSTNSFVTAQGAGAMLLFSVISLYRSAREYVYLTRGREWGEKLRVAAPLVGLVFFQTILWIWVMWNGVNILVALGFVLFITLITLGLMRIVAEAGMYWVQSHAGFFHVAKMLGLGGVTSGPMIAALMPIYMVLFVDIKTFIAPNMLNAARVEKAVNVGRFRYHFILITSVILTVFFAIGTTLIIAHELGGQSMQGWFYNRMPVFTMDSARMFAESADVFDLTNFIWYSIGAAWVGFSMWLRQTMFWFPHPIGYILLFSTLFRFVWFSFFIGWFFKAIVVKYGGKATYDVVRPLFIGLIIGELLMIAFWTVVGSIDDFRHGLSHNKMEP